MATQHRELAQIVSSVGRAAFTLPTMPDWVEQGLCAQTDPEAFFPEKGGSTRDAKATCAQCPVSTDCLQYAIDNQERFGVWGGTSERQRREIIAGRAS